MEQIKLTNTEAASLGKLFVEVSMFAGTDDYRPILTGVLFGRDAEGKLRMVATDSYKLAVFTSTIDAPEGLCSLVHGKELSAIGKELGKLKPNYSDDAPSVVLSFGEASMLAETTTWTRTAVMIEGAFPNWEQFPQLTATETVEGSPALNVAHLAVFGKVTLGRTAKTSSTALQVSTFGELKPARFTASSEHGSFVGLLMPVRIA